MRKLRNLFLALAALALCEIARELYTFKMTYYHIATEKIRGRHRILFLSDLHNRSYGKENGRLLGAIRRAKPELILIGGDMLVAKNGHNYRTAADFIKKLPAICPVYCANGNHEQRMKELPGKYRQSYLSYKRELKEAGAHFLENESQEILLGGAAVRLTGLEIPKKYYRKLSGKHMPEHTLERLIGPSAPSGCQILLAHNPSYREEYLKWGADLVLCGHFHGGLVRIPGFRGVVSPDFRLFPKYAGGCYREGAQTLVVSRGLGNHTLPLRLFNPAEVVALELEEPGFRSNSQ